MKKNLLLFLFLSTIFNLNLFASKNLYLSYKNIPSHVYKNQRFEVTVKAVVTTDSFDTISSSFGKGKNMSILNPDEPWVKIGSNEYENKYYFKISKNNFIFPQFTVKLYDGREIVDLSSLEAPNVIFSDVGKSDGRFSKVIADSIVLKAYKTKQYNNKEALTIIDIDAKNSNLEDFNLQNIEEQGISNIKETSTGQNLVYYFVTPVHQKKLVFTYYNEPTKSFKEVVVPLILQNELVSTQTDLNPNDSSFEKYKKTAVVILFVIFLILAVIKRKRYLIVISVILFVITVVYFLPNKTGTLKKGTYVYILPTKNSTIFFQLDNEQNVEILDNKQGFVKILGIDKQFIGWVKEDSFGKN